MRAQTWLNGWLAVALLSVSGMASAEGSGGKFPEDEQGFVNTVGKLNRAQLVALLGEPSKAEDVKLKDSGRVVASIWHYHNINKDPQGAYYPTTELDLIDDQVSVVVFLNNDGSDASTGQTYEVQPNPADL